MGYREYRFCYRIEPAAGLAYNEETGEDEEVYMQVKIEGTIEDQKYSELHEDILKETVAEQLGLNPDFITPISIHEYDFNVDEDENLYEEDEY